MWEEVGEIVLWLVLAGVAGLVAGWLLRAARDEVRRDRDEPEHEERPAGEVSSRSTAVRVSPAEARVAADHGAWGDVVEPGHRGVRVTGVAPPPLPAPGALEPAASEPAAAEATMSLEPLPTAEPAPGDTVVLGAETGQRAEADGEPPPAAEPAPALDDTVTIPTGSVAPAASDSAGDTVSPGREAAGGEPEQAAGGEPEQEPAGEPAVEEIAPLAGPPVVEEPVRIRVSHQPMPLSPSRAAAAREFAQAGAIADTGDVEAIEGIGPAYGRKLREAGVATIRALLDRGALPAGRTALAGETGIALRLILTWVNHADLLRIPGVDPQAAELLEVAGVDSPTELARRNATNLALTLKQVDDEKRLVPTVPTEAAVEGWIAHARRLDKLVEH